MIQRFAGFLRKQPICAQGGILMGVTVGGIASWGLLMHPGPGETTLWSMLLSWLILAIFAAFLVGGLVAIRMKRMHIRLSQQTRPLFIASAFLVSFLILLLGAVLPRALLPLLSVLGAVIGWIVGRTLCRACGDARRDIAR